ncbi:30S ribosomal protein S6 [Candidatus Annandia pinicola]|uniref:30S ribosomal protein S6 n=1 Tax=Candidatus Annandia pinicola TaxID=1345117 RepID=UPI001D00E520|nr:30S ribosomal protein S6 [Candidatus Annandia pinicola]UDG80252.1 30S ribosomal protein S6 [Candidatus Annandia pinicola]
MRNYEIVIIFCTEVVNKIHDIVKLYKKIINKDNGKIHRIEYWGLRKLAYPIKRINHAYYMLINIEVTKKIINNLRYEFKLNNIIIRNLIIRKKKPCIGDSFILRKSKKKLKKNKKKI